MNKTILVVDDEPYMLRLMKYHLEKAGYEAISARNGREALNLVSSAAPRLVVLDVMMADLDGLSVLQELRQHEATRELPVIIITASAHHATRQQAESNGATLFFTKPFSPTQILADIRRLAPLDDTPEAA